MFWLMICVPTIRLDGAGQCWRECCWMATGAAATLRTAHHQAPHWGTPTRLITEKQLHYYKLTE